MRKEWFSNDRDSASSCPSLSSSTPLRFCPGSRLIRACGQTLTFITPHGNFDMSGLTRLWWELTPLFEANETRGKIEEWIDGQYYSVSGEELVDTLLAWEIVEPAAGPPASAAYRQALRRHSLSPPADMNEALRRWLPDKAKKYKDAPLVELPSATEITAPLDRVVLERKSARRYAVSQLPLPHLSALLYLAYGPSRPETGTMDPVKLWPNSKIAADAPTPVKFERIRRPAPSGGALYPLEIYPVVFNVAGLPKGLYHYQRDEHKLELLNPEDNCRQLEDIFYRLIEMKSAGVLFLMSAVFSRSYKKYGESGYRLALFEAGHVAQNFLLTAVGLGLTGIPLAGFKDEAINRYLGFEDDGEEVVYAVCVGYPETGDGVISAGEGCCPKGR